MNNNWKSVSIPKGLYEVISDFVNQDPRYRSIAEFVSEALRSRLEVLQATREGS